MSIPRERDLMMAYCVPGKRGLNIGCGDIPLGNSIGFDMRRTAKAATIIGDCTKLPFEDESMDYIVSLHCLEHVRVSPRVVLDEWNRVLKPNGILAVNVPDGDFYEFLARSGSEQEAERLLLDCWPWISNGHREQHWQSFTMFTLSELFTSEGFRVTNIERIDRRPIRPEPTLMCVGTKQRWMRDSKIP